MFYFIIIFCLLFFSTNYNKDLRWDWKNIDTSTLWFPKNFFWGCSDSAFQTEGIETVDHQTIENSWTQFEKHINLPMESRVQFGCNRWQLYKDDIQLIANCRMNMYRFSIEWAKIEPEEGAFNQKALQHYIDLVDKLLRQGITPMITLFHHTLPIWFAKKGGFEHKYNTFYFLRFAKYVFKQLHQKIPYWVLMNEPVAYAIEAYWRSHYPPAKNNLKLAAQVAANMLNAHVEVTQHLKQINPATNIGIIHVINLLDNYHPWNLLESMVTTFFDRIVNQSTIQFFKTGIFHWPFIIKCKNKQAMHALDFIGINYYTHTTIKHSALFTIRPQVLPYETALTENLDDGRGQKVLYPEGLYRAIKRAAALHLPIFITENGSSTHNPNLTQEYLTKHIYTVSRAIKDGYNVQGYLLWTLTDCYGWQKGYTAKHGMYHVDFATQKRTWRSAFDYYLHVIQRFSN